MRTFFGCSLLVLVVACGDDPPTNRAPAIAAQAQVTAEDTPLDLVVAIDDGDGDPVTVTASAPAHGRLEGVAPAWRYVPDADFHGVDGFEVVASDGLDAAAAHVSITVMAVNDAPASGGDAVAAHEDVELHLPAATLLANDDDVDGDTLAVVAVSGAEGGQVALVGTDVVFVPAPDAHGPARFTYQISDGELTSEAVVEVAVGGVNDAPVAAGDSAATDEDTAVVIAVAVLVGNDVDADGQSLSLTAVGDASAGAVALDGGTVTYTPPADFHGSATFTYTVSDGADLDLATVTVQVAAINDAPAAIGDALFVEEDGVLLTPVAALLGNDADVDGDVLVVTAVRSLSGKAVTGGTVVLEDGFAVFTPDPDFHGVTAFAYTISDGAATSSAMASVMVYAVNDAPDVADDAVVTTEDVAVAVAGSFLTGNDADVDHDPLTVVGVGSASGGTVVLEDGVATFTPAADFHGLASFGYVVSDGTVSVPATVRVQVSPVVECGDGEQEGDEACDDHNLSAGDGCDASCAVETGAYVTTPPVLVSGALACTVASSNGGRKVAADRDGHVYVAMSCAGGVHLAVSSDHGASYAAPIAVGIAAPWDVAVAAGGPGIAHVVATVDGEVWYSRTDDGGATWTTPGAVATTNDSELSIVADGYQVWIGAGRSGGVAVLRVERGSSTGWSSHEVVCSQDSFELVVDARDGHLILISEAADVAIRASLDGGASFDNPKSVPGPGPHSDFAAGGGHLFAAGAGPLASALFRIPIDEPAAADVIDGLPIAGASQRAVSADPAGNVYVVSATAGGVQLDQLANGTAGFSTRSLAAAGHYPGVSALPTSEGAAVVYEDGAGAVLATIQTYD